jgi:hypothetical protein
VAVYQISKIQIRRGKQNQGTGLPQLASGEMAWAVDTQELYIGNGSVSEGAPAVGNTKIITQQDLAAQGNLISLIQYVYKSSDSTITTGVSATTPVYRSLVSRLDDQVTTADFGAVGDGATDDTIALQRAIYQLFLNPSHTAVSTPGSRVVLNLPAGVYKTTSTIFIPSYATLVGAGADKSIISYTPPTVGVTGTTNSGSPLLTTTSAAQSMVGQIVTGTGIPDNTFVLSAVTGTSLTLSKNATASGTTFNLNGGPAIQFINDHSSISGGIETSATDSTSQPRNIALSNLSVSVNNALGLNSCLQLNYVKDSVFDNINLLGSTSDTLSLNSASRGINLISNTGFATSHNIFRNVNFSNFTYAVYTDQDIVNNSFDSCYISNAFIGFALGLNWVSTAFNPNGPQQTEIANTKFYQVYQQGVYINKGKGNIVRDCKFIGVGNAAGTNATSQYSQIYFTTPGNSVQNIVSDRHSDLYSPDNSVNPTYYAIPYVPEVSGLGTYSMAGVNSITLNRFVPTQFLKLPVAWSAGTITPSVQAGGPVGYVTYNIDYTYHSSQGFTRRGTLNISVDVANKKISLSDEYDFAGSDNATDDTAVKLNFSAQLLDQNGNAYLGGLTPPYGFVLIYSNTGSDTGPFTYTYSSIFSV